MVNAFHGTPRSYILERVSIEDRGHTSPCWVWTLCRNAKGYGVCKFKSAWIRAHRMAYLVFVGPIPEDLQLDHLCRNKACCNPDHLEAVSLQENVRRRSAWCHAAREGSVQSQKCLQSIHHGGANT